MSFVRTQRRLLEAATRDRAPHRYWDELREALDTNQISFRDWSIREIWEEFVPDGRELMSYFDPRNGSNTMLTEAGSAVKTSDFSNITGQLLVKETLDAFEDPGFLFPLLVNDVQTQLSGERVPGVTRIGDEAQSIGEAQQYPLAAVSETFIDTPATVKRGMIVPVTKEAIFFDLTGQLISRASEVGYWMGQNKEKRVLDVVFGIVNNYKRNSVTDDTYGNTHNTGDFDNIAGSNALVDWTDLEQTELLFDAITDPDTGEPISIVPNVIIVPTALKHTASRIVNATGIETGVRATGAGAGPVAASAQPTGNQYTIVSGPMVQSRTSSASEWYIGNPKKAFIYQQNFPITSVQSSVNSEAEFNQDIVMQHKVSERGVPAVIEPRQMVRATAS